jgi:hypothetical protein
MLLHGTDVWSIQLCNRDSDVCLWYLDFGSRIVGLLTRENTEKPGK